MSSRMNLRVSKMVSSIVGDYIMECSKLYNFNGEEAVRRLLSSDLKVNKKVVSKLSWPMPFVHECVKSENCQGLKYNSGLFTQCEKNKEEGEFCKVCFEEGEKNGTGIPDNGCIEERMKCGVMEFKDRKGRKPVSFLSILKKKNISVEKVREDAKSLNITIDEEHFNEVKKEKKEKKEVDKRGRPKKAPKEVEANGVVDLFADLVEEAVIGKVEEVVKEVIVEDTKAKKVKVSAEEKEAKKAEEKASKEAAKLAKKEAEKQAREEKRASEKVAKALEKASKKSEKKVKKTEEVAVPIVAPVKVVAEEARAKVTVTRFEHEGKKYLKSTENILYDPDTKEEMGIWCEESKTIKALPEDDEEEID